LIKVASGLAEVISAAFSHEWLEPIKTVHAITLWREKLWYLGFSVNCPRQLDIWSVIGSTVMHCQSHACGASHSTRQFSLMDPAFRAVILPLQLFQIVNQPFCS